MTLLVVFFASLAAMAAALCALADGALLSLEDDARQSNLNTVGSRRERAHRALAFGRILSQLLAGAGAAAAMKVSGVPAGQVAPGVVVLGILIVIVSESAARTAGDALGSRAVGRLAPVVLAIEHLLHPVVTFGAWSDSLLQRMLPLSTPDAEHREATLEQFREVVAVEADVSHDEALLLKGVFSLGKTEVREIMVPRVDVIGVGRNTTWSALLDRVRSARHSRLLVFDGTLDEVFGVLYAKDLLPALINGEEPAGGWLALVRPATFIPATKSVDAQLRDFKSSHRHLAIVVDEYGGTAGIVTLEDALELIVGEIRDEYDVEEAAVVREDGDKFWVSARLSLEELSELTGQTFMRDDVRTVGGLIYEIVGRVPRNGEALQLGQYRLVVERVVRRRIERVYLERLHVTTRGAA